MNLDKLINGLERIARNLDERKLHKMLDELGKYGVEFAKERVYNIDTGTTRDSITYQVEGNKLTIEAGGNAVWIEFGTGITYNSEGYPGELPDGIVPHGTYGKGQGANDKGWWYPLDKPYGSDAIETEDGMWLNHTYGIPSNHFMWDTINAVEEKAQEMGMEILDKEFKAL